MFSVHEVLKKDSFYLGEFKLSEILVMDNAYYPWLILVPKKEEIIELIDLEAAEQKLLMEEISNAASIVKTVFAPFKLNIATLGNVVRQLHIHIVARKENDPTWPDPVWGKDKPRKLYTKEEKETILTKLISEFSKLPEFSYQKAHQFL